MIMTNFLLPGHILFINNDSYLNFTYINPFNIALIIDKI